VSVPEGLWQKLVVQPLHVLLGADRVVQTRQLEAVVVVSEVVETGNKNYLFGFNDLLFLHQCTFKYAVQMIGTWKRVWSKLG
jgi:hypothetical protein